jgi:hypothetical protein
MRKWQFVLLLVVGAALLGSTVFREPIARAAQSVSATIAGPLDDQGNVKVHEQGTAPVRSANNEVVVSHTLQGEPGPFGNCDDNEPIYTVPAGKTLVVEYIGSEAAGEDAVAAAGSVFGSNDEGVLPLTYEKAFGGRFSASDAVHFDFAAGTVLRIGASLSQALGCTFTIAIGGYLQPSS